VAKTLAQWREHKGWSYEEVSMRTGIAKPTVVAHHQRGVMPSLDFGIRYARCYGTTAEAILKGIRNAMGH